MPQRKHIFQLVITAPDDAEVDDLSSALDNIIEVGYADAVDTAQDPELCNDLVDLIHRCDISAPIYVKSGRAVPDEEEEEPEEDDE